MSDLIKREDVIRKIDEWIQCGTDRDDDIVISEFLSFLKGDINAIPSADRLTGEWLLLDDEHHIEKIYLCSNCKSFEAWGESEKYNYCPTCGARMKGADDVLEGDRCK